MSVTLGHLFGDELRAFRRRSHEYQGDAEDKSASESHAHDFIVTFKSSFMSLGSAPLRLSFFNALSKRLDSVTSRSFSLLGPCQGLLSKGLERFPIFLFEGCSPFTTNALILLRFSLFPHAVARRHTSCAMKLAAGEGAG